MVECRHYQGNGNLAPKNIGALDRAMPWTADRRNGQRVIVGQRKFVLPSGQSSWVSRSTLNHQPSTSSAVSPRRCRCREGVGERSCSNARNIEEELKSQSRRRAIESFT